MVKPKKHLGQHFLTDQSIALDIVKGVRSHQQGIKILEIGPGTGVLTQFLAEDYKDDLVLIDLDKESIDYLKKHYSQLEKIIYGDFLKMDLREYVGDKYIVIGNFPYNISSQIFFKILDDRDSVIEVVGMLQKEVAERLTSPPGNKTYGILSVFLQAFYDVEYLFTVGREVFDPPPKVQSGVIRLVRNKRKSLNCDEKLFKTVVKQGFQNRRKTLRNALKPLNLNDELKLLPILNKRAEELAVEDFEELTNQIDSGRINEV